MKNLSSIATTYILGIILIGFGVVLWTVSELEWADMGMYLLAALGAVAQTLKLEGPNKRTNYSIAWFVYGFAFVAFGPATAVFVIVLAHLAEWAWHKYPWYIQAFNIANHVISVFLAGLIFQAVREGDQLLDLASAMAMVAANLVFVLGNHFFVGLVVRLARGQSFAESGVFEFLTLFIDFTVLSMGTLTALLWSYSPFVSILNILPLYLLYNALRVPALKRQLEEMKRLGGELKLSANGD
jgi:hypothetical protein